MLENDLWRDVLVPSLHKSYRHYGWVVHKP